MRSLFRRLCGTLGAGDGEATPGALRRKVRLRHGDTLVVDSLPAVLQLDLLKRFLAEGFQAHLQVRLGGLVGCDAVQPDRSSGCVL